MGLNLEELAAKFEDDSEYELNGEKFKGSDFKAYVKSQNDRATTLQQHADQSAAEAADYRKKFEDTSTSTAQLLREAARVASQPDPLRSPTQQPADEYEAAYGTDPIFGDFGKKYGKHMLTAVQNEVLTPFVNNQLAPILKRVEDTNKYLTTALLDEQIRREYREVGEWPADYDVEKVRNYAKEHKYFRTGAEAWEVPDIRRVNDELMRPVRERTREEQIRKEATEQAAINLRQNMNVIQMPNRSIGANGKPVAAKGNTPDQIFGNIVNDAMNDPETLRMIAGQNK